MSPHAERTHPTGLRRRQSASNDETLLCDCTEYISNVKSDAGAITVYVLKVYRANPDGTLSEPPTTVRRRYSEFEALFLDLRRDHPSVAQFTFPGKSVGWTSDSERASRRKRFNDFVHVLAGLRPMPAAVRRFFVPAAAATAAAVRAPSSPASQLAVAAAGRGGVTTVGRGEAGEAEKAGLYGSPAWQSHWRGQAMRKAALCPAGDKVHYPIGTLEVTLVEGFGLPAADFGVSSDPFARLTLTGYWSHGQEWPKAMRKAFTSPIKSTTLNPQWNYKIPTPFVVPRAGGVLRVEVRDMVLMVFVFGDAFARPPRHRGLSFTPFSHPVRATAPKVFDHDATSADDLLGYVEVPLEALTSAKPVRAWLRLKAAKEFRGEDLVGKRLKGRTGKRACVLVDLHYRFAPWGDALTGLVWPEAPREYVPRPFDIERTLTEVFKTLRLINPIIQFFSADDLTGLVNNWNWDLPLRSAGWLCFLAVLYLWCPHAIWSFLQAYAAYVSFRQWQRRRLRLLNYRVGRYLRSLRAHRHPPLPYGHPLSAQEAAAASVALRGAAQRRFDLDPEVTVAAAAFDPLQLSEADLLKSLAGATGAAGGALLDGGMAVVGTGAAAVNMVTLGIAGRVANAAATVGHAAIDAVTTARPDAQAGEHGAGLQRWSVAGPGAFDAAAVLDIARMVDSSMAASRSPPQPAFWGKPEDAKDDT